MKSQKTIKLDKDIALRLEYKIFQMQSYHNLIQQFLINVYEFEYKEAHVDLILQKYSDTTVKVKKIILEIAKENQVKNIKLNDFEYHYHEGLLVINY